MATHESRARVPKIRNRLSVFVDKMKPRKLQRSAAGREHIALPPSAAEHPDNFARMLFRDEASLHTTHGLTKGEHASDGPIIERVVKAYLADTTDASKPSAIWETIYNTRQKPLHDIMSGNARPAIERLLRRPADSDLFYGFDGTTAEYAIKTPADFDRAVRYSKIVLDHLLKAAEIMGALRHENIEAGVDNYGSMPIDQLLLALDRHLDTTLGFPNPYPGETGVQSGRGVISYRAVHAIYQAWRIRELVKGIPNPRVLEIGGGLGRTAYYSWQLGIRDYTIVDLPFTGISQGYFLMRTLGEEKVTLHGETSAASTIKIVQPNAFLDSHDRYDLIVNVDSMTEMDCDAAEKYWRHTKACSPVFLSINHEFNDLAVWELASKDLDVKVAQRYPYGIRKGYTEETFWFNQPI